MEELNNKIKEITSSGASSKEMINGLLELDRGLEYLFESCTEDCLKMANNMSKMIYKAIIKIDKSKGDLLIIKTGE